MKEKLLIESALSFVGTQEDGDNSGALIQEFQKAVDGKAQKESWCLAFVQYCVKKIDETTGGEKTCLFPTEHVMTLWHKTCPEARLNKPIPGCLVLWQFWKDGQPTSSGHVGIVTQVTLNALITCEGNTSPSGEGIQREGDGVYIKKRSLTGTSTMKVKGFLAPWLH